MDMFLQQVVNGLITGSFYALIALGYSMVFGVIKLLNFAHGDIYMTGGFVGLGILTVISGFAGSGWLGVMLALVFSVLAVGLLGVFIERVAYRPMRGAPRLSILITALAASMVLNSSILALTGGRHEAFYADLGFAGFFVGDVRITLTQFVLVGLSIALMIGLELFVSRTLYGKAMRAVAIDMNAARLMGIDVDRVISLTFFIGSGLAAAGGVMAGAYYGSLHFFMGFTMGLKAFTAAVIGGIGSIPGAMLGGILLGLLEAFSSSLLLCQLGVERRLRLRGADRFPGLQADRSARAKPRGARMMNVAEETTQEGTKEPAPTFGADRRTAQIGVALLISAALLPLVSNSYTLEVGTMILLYMVLCLGLNVVVGYAGLLDLGYAAFFAVGAYSAGILTTQFGFNFWLTVPVAIVAACIAGVIIGAPTLRLRSDYLAIVTLGFGEIVRIIARNLEVTGGASGLIGIQRPSLFGYELNHVAHYYYAFLILVVLTIFVCVSIGRSRIGRAWLYVRYDEDAAAGIGINRVAVKLYAYVTGAVIASIAGTLYAAKMTAISPESFTFMQSLLILLGVVLGGMGKIPGVILGAAVMTLLPEIMREAGTYRPLVTALALLALMLLRPHGLWPDRRA
ncbi:hypothetical protein QO058_20775 [Bosea vestrisii]|uniref:ABC transporter permease n=1 Tax=Bosea vestrisii TaxID=151416 RepID=UPI0024DFDA7D|nr:hypothetical protein [Bosea vestrisii]WID95207.1 hypothetical protein QO058_20775 [Bosea vestrisii]